MSDPFDINKIDSVSGGAGQAGFIPPPVTSQAAQARLMEGVGGGSPPAAAGGATPVPASDQVRFSGESEEAAGGGGLGHLLAAWGDAPAAAPVAPATPGWGLTQQSGPAPGIQAGFTFGPGGMGGVEAGMQAGAVYSSPVLRL